MPRAMIEFLLAYQLSSTYENGIATSISASFDAEAGMIFSSLKNHVKHLQQQDHV
jgi:hypothetical protein